MKSLRPSLALTASILVLGLGYVASTHADSPKVYQGRVTFRGEMQNEAKPGSLSFVARGKLTHAESGDVVTVSMGGLFRSTTRRIVRTAYTGRMKTYVNNHGKVTSTNKRVRLRVNRRYIRIPGGRLRFTRAPKANVDTLQRVRGVGIFRVSS